MTVITVTELKKNLGKYLERSATEDIVVTKHGKTISIIKSPDQGRQDMLEALVGIAADNPMSLEDARGERLARQ